MIRHSLTIAIIPREARTCWAESLRTAGYGVERFSVQQFSNRTGGSARQDLIVLADHPGGTLGAVEATVRIRRSGVATPVIVIARESSESIVIAALRAGVNEYIKEPTNGEELVKAVERLVGAPRNRESTSLPVMVGDSEAIRSIGAYACQVARSNSTVLITGETGTGKELVAQLIHSMSPRYCQPFVALNCAAVPDGLLESELFGRERGAYTGADTTYEGKLKHADGGTVLFDEIGDLTPLGQAKLLRVLESRQAQRLGSSKEIPLDLRIIAATNRSLANMVTGGLFRRDLYFRLNVTRVELPPLRTRRDDVPVLVRHFASDFEIAFSRSFPGFSTRAMKTLVNYNWPGNIRQLRNVVEELFVRLPERPIDVQDLPTEITGRDPIVELEPADERTRIVSALTSTRWNKKRAAERLCWSRMTLYRKMALHQIAHPDDHGIQVSHCDSACDTCE